MPHLLHHKRRHSWPYCGPIARSGTAGSAPTKLVSLPRPPQVHPQYTVPLLSSDLLSSEEQDDDAASAGIIRSRRKKGNRLWSTHTSTVKNPEGWVPVSNDGGGGGGDDISAPVSAPVTTLPRQIARPLLDKTRSLPALPSSATTTGAPIPDARANMVSRWDPRASVPAQQPRLTYNAVRDNTMAASGQHEILSMKRHRRCHSGRPRSWREPSASVWTLVED